MTIPPYPTRETQRGSKGVYLTEHQPFISHFLVQTIVYMDTLWVGDSKQYFLFGSTGEDNLPQEDTAYIFTTFKMSKFENFRMST